MRTLPQIAIEQVTDFDAPAIRGLIWSDRIEADIDPEVPAIHYIAKTPLGDMRIHYTPEPAPNDAPLTSPLYAVNPPFTISEGSDYLTTAFIRSHTLEDAKQKAQAAWNRIAVAMFQTSSLSGHEISEAVRLHLNQGTDLADYVRVDGDKETVECPHCEGSGRVPDNFLSEDFVDEVFTDYCKIFSYHNARGVHDYSESGHTVRIRQDVSAKSCFDTRDFYLPWEYFTRNVDKRRALMTADNEKGIAEKKEKDRKQAEAKVAILKLELARAEAKASGVEL
jgi:hypothetical protein